MNGTGRQENIDIYCYGRRYLGKVQPTTDCWWVELSLGGASAFKVGRLSCDLLVQYTQRALNNTRHLEASCAVLWDAWTVRSR